MAEVTVYTPTGGKIRTGAKSADMYGGGYNVVKKKK